MRVVVTGATGFVGAYLVRALTARGHRVVAFARASSRTGPIEALGAQVVRGSLLDPADARRALDGAEAVVHAAGGGLAADARTLHRTNAETTRTLVEAAGDLARFVLVSSLAAHGPSRPGRPAREGDPDAPRSAYGRSKLAAERIALAHKERFGVTVLRPPALYGPGERRLVPLFRAARRGWVPMARPDGTLSMLHGADCARAIVAALDNPHPSGVYYLAEERPYTRRELVAHIGQAVGVRPRIAAIPAPALSALGFAVELHARLVGGAPAFTRDKAKDAAAAHQACASDLARRALGWRSVHRLEEGARACARDFEARGWL